MHHLKSFAGLLMMLFWLKWILNLKNPFEEVNKWNEHISLWTSNEISWWRAGYSDEAHISVLLYILLIRRFFLPNITTKTPRLDAFAVANGDILQTNANAKVFIPLPSACFHIEHSTGHPSVRGIFDKPTKEYKIIVPNMAYCLQMKQTILILIIFLIKMFSFSLMFMLNKILEHIQILSKTTKQLKSFISICWTKPDHIRVGVVNVGKAFTTSIQGHVFLMHSWLTPIQWRIMKKFWHLWNFTSSMAIMLMISVQFVFQRIAYSPEWDRCHELFIVFGLWLGGADPHRVVPVCHHPM